MAGGRGAVGVLEVRGGQSVERAGVPRVLGGAVCDVPGVRGGQSAGARGVRGVRGVFSQHAGQAVEEVAGQFAGPVGVVGLRVSWGCILRDEVHFGVVPAGWRRLAGSSPVVRPAGSPPPFFRCGRGLFADMKPVPFEILLIDDDPDLHGVIRASLEQAGVRFADAYNGREGLDCAAAGRRDLIVLDVTMPGMDGWEVLRELKADPELRGIPVVMLTAGNSIQDKVRAFEWGAIDFVTKPFVPAELRARIMAVLRAKTLQDQLLESNKELTAARQAAEAATRAKSQFLANMSHELRTPMNGVIAMTDLLLESPLTREQRELVETIREGGEALLAQINNILDFSKIECGKMELEREPLQLRQCVERALDLLAPKAAEKGLNLACELADDVPAWVVGDFMRLRQVFLNLLGNAIKFTARGEIVVAARVTKTGPDGLREVHFTVRDTGIGIAGAALGRLFQSFMQVDAATTRRFGGTGLGLAISKNLVELMDGRIWAESREGEGAAFHFVLPLTATKLDEAPLPHVASPALAGRRLLVASDSATNRRLLAACAGRWGMRVTEAGELGAVVAALNAPEPPELAILDADMRDMLEARLLHLIRAFPAGQALPLLALAYPGQKSMGQGAVRWWAGVVGKPLKEAQLSAVLLEVLAGVRMPAPVARRATTRIDVKLGATLPLRVLVVDDNAINQKVGVRVLRQMGYDARVAAGGQEAIELLARERFDVLFMDVQMPELDGLETARRIRRSTGPLSPVIIAMTANALSGDREKCLEAGMNDYLSKPVRPEIVQDMLRYWGPLAVGAGVPGTAPKAGAPATEVKPAAEVKPAPTTPAATTVATTRGVAEEGKLTSGGGAVVDLSRLENVSGGDAGMIQELLELYLQQTPQTLAKLQVAFDAANAADVQRLAHNSVGASASCGIVGMVPLMRAMEKCGQEGQLAGVAEALEKARVEFARVRRFVEARPRVSASGAV